MTDRPESPGDDAVELASRYLDGDLSVDERAAAESDPAVMAWVERFGGIRAALREPVDVDAAQRSAAIAAALTAADVTPPEAAPPPGRDELAAARARRAGRMGKWLGAAAAVAALAIGGAVLAGNSGGGDDSADEPDVMSAANEVAPAATDADSKRLTDEEASTEAPSAAMSASEPAPAADSAATTTASGETTSPDATARDQDASGGAGNETTAAGAATTAQTTAGPLSFDVPEDLQVLAEAEPVTLPADREPPCVEQATGELVAVEVFYADQPAAVYRDGQRLTLTAWAVDSCVVLAEYGYAD